MKPEFNEDSGFYEPIALGSVTSDITQTNSDFYEAHDFMNILLRSHEIH